MRAASHARFLDGQPKWLVQSYRLTTPRVIRPRLSVSLKAVGTTVAGLEVATKVFETRNVDLGESSETIIEGGRD